MICFPKRLAHDIACCNSLVLLWGICCFRLLSPGVWIVFIGAFLHLALLTVQTFSTFIFPSCIPNFQERLCLCFCVPLHTCRECKNENECAVASTTAFFGSEATSPLARLLWMLPGAACQTSSKKKKDKKRSKYVALDFSEKTNPKKKDKKRSEYVALDFSADFLFFYFLFCFFIFVNLREGEKNPKKQIQKKKDKKKANT